MNACSDGPEVSVFATATEAALFRRSPVPMSVHGIDGGLLAVNQAFASLCGCKLADCSRQGILACLAPSERVATVDQIRDRLSGGGESASVRTALLGVMGEQRVVDVTASLAAGPGGERYVFAVYRDATHEEWNAPSGCHVALG